MNHKYSFDRQKKNPQHSSICDLKSRKYLVLVDPDSRVGVPGVEALREPQGDLVLGSLDGVRSVADVSSDIKGEVATDGSRSGVDWLGGTQHNTAGLDSVQALPDHAADRTGGHVLNKASEETLGGKVSVVSLEQLTLRGVQLKAHELEALKMEIIYVRT
jgi:hypothetical protein